MQLTYNFTPNFRSFVSNDPADCCCCVALLHATSFEHGYSTTDDLVCCAVSEERVCNNCAMCIVHTISPGTTQPSIHLCLVQEIIAESMHLQRQELKQQKGNIPFKRLQNQRCEVTFWHFSVPTSQDQYFGVNRSLLDILLVSVLLCHVTTSN
jgi:hypothetical protein